MHSMFQSFTGSLRESDPDLIDTINYAHNILFTEGVNSIEELNEYFSSVKKPKRQSTSLSSMNGTHRLSTRQGPGRGSLSYNPQDPRQAAYNANSN